MLVYINKSSDYIIQRHTGPPRVVETLSSNNLPIDSLSMPCCYASNEVSLFVAYEVVLSKRSFEKQVVGLYFRIMESFLYIVRREHNASGARHWWGSRKLFVKIACG
jgi:hypothetical protein